MNTRTCITVSWRSRGWRLLLPLCSLVLSSCAPEAERSWQGYAEGEYVYVAAPRAGRLLELGVQRGTTVAVGAPLFVLDPEPEAAAVAEARRHLEQFRFRRADLDLGLRPTELAALRARLDQARANLTLAEAEAGRRERLFANSIIPREELDRSRAELARNRAAVADLEAQLATARLGARRDQRQAASAEAEAAANALAQAQWALAEKHPSAPVSGLVYDLLYRVGEYVPAGRPVVVLLPPEQVKARFFVPERELAQLQPGGSVRVLRDGVPELRATISYISPQAEFTPPVIYSNESRGKLVYLVEARPEPNAAPPLQPGQPLTVRPGTAP